MSNRSLHDEVVGRIRDMIIEGEILAGAHVPERIICEKLGISRTPLREAYKVLAAEGVLTLLPNRGAVVTQLTQQDVDDILRMIGLIEGTAAERACGLISAAEIHAIEDLHNQMIEYFEQRAISDYFKINQRIHAAIVAAAQSPQMQLTHSALSKRVQRYRFAGNAESARWSRAVREHEQILITLKDRDGALLNAMLQAHLRNGWKIVRERNRDELAEANGEIRLVS